MSILIKGMEMPKNGDLVELLIWSDGHVTKTGDSYIAEDGRAYYKPCDWEYFSAIEIPEPHGRLIDADALRLSHCAECTRWNRTCFGGNSDCDWDCIYHIDHAPTVIEAEAGEQ